MKRKIRLFAALVLITGGIIVLASSCRTTGYGCHGTGRTITGYKSSLGFGY